MEHFNFFQTYQYIIMARTESQRKFGLPRGRNLPFTLESRKGNYQRLQAQKSELRVGSKNACPNRTEITICYQSVLT